MGDTAKPTVKVLNEQPKAGKSDLKAPDLAKKLQKTMLSIKGECIGEDRGIDYDKLKSSAAYKEYKSETLFLQTVSLDELSENDRKAFFINLYNALTIHGLAEQATLPSSVLDIQQFWKTTGYNVGGLVYSLDDIEHGILRGNKSHPASTKPQFSEGDPRLKYAVKKLDPRIHFALVCGAVSCPAINVYTADNLDKALDSATRNFCKQEVSMFTEVDEVWMSKIFLWYRDDFGGNDVDVIEWVMPYLEKDIQDRAVVLLFKIKNLPLPQSVTGNQPLATPPVQFQYVGQPQSLVQPPSSVQPLNSTQQAMRIPGPQTQGLPQTIMGPPHQVLSSGGSILYPIQISQSGPSLMSGGPVVISQTGQQVPQPGSMIISHPGQHPSQGPPMVVSQTKPHPQAMTGNLAFHGRFP